MIDSLGREENVYKTEESRRDALLKQKRTRDVREKKFGWDGGAHKRVLGRMGVLPRIRAERKALRAKNLEDFKSLELEIDW